MDSRLRFVILLAVLFHSTALWAQEVRIEVQADRVLHPLSRYLTGACIEDVNHEIYGGIYSQMVFGESFQEPPSARHRRRGVRSGDTANVGEVSGMWRSLQTGSAAGTFSLETDRPFVGRQSQRLTFIRGQGRVGIENRGLNRWGMYFAADKPYEGTLWARADAPVDLFAALENNDGSRSLAEERLSVKPGGWQRFTFKLTPRSTEKSARLAITLGKPGTAVLGYVSLQAGDWGRFKGLPVRRDVAEALVAQGITVLRYGGSMVNHPEYRWKKMIGPRDSRQPYRGTWYAYSSNGWGIPDFMDFCEAAGFEYVPAFNASETPPDMADFVEYAKGPPGSEWGRRRIADGHAAPYRLKYIELGNEEKVDDAYYRKFAALAGAIWAKDANIILVVGDFLYSKSISDPFRFSGAASGITSLAAHEKILRLARQHGREVWFDVHVGTDGPTPDSSLAGTRSYIDALEHIASGARHRVVVFELNAGNHSHAPRLGQRVGHQRACPRRAAADRDFGQLPAGRRPERQRLGPGPSFPQPVASLAATSGLRHADVLTELSAAGGPGTRDRRVERAGCDRHKQPRRPDTRVANGKSNGQT